MRGGVPAAGMLGVLLHVSVAGGQTPRDSRLETADRVAVRVEHFTGAVDRHCGIYLLESPGAAVERRHVTTAVRCVADAKRRGRPTWALWQTGYGIEGPIFAGVATSPVSDAHLVSGSVGMSLQVTLVPCLTPRVQKDATIACRNRGGPLSSDDMADALDKLRRDVTRTLDDAGAPLVEAARQRVAAGADPSHPGFFQAVVDDLQRAVEGAAGTPWPVCPIHHDHALEHRDRYWLCQRDGVFVAAVGALPTRPKGPR